MSRTVTGHPVPPERMPLVRGGRPLKRWRYLGGYGPDVCLCLGVVQVGPGVQTFWAVWDRAGRRLTERTVLGRRGVRLGAPGTPVEVASVRGRDVEIDLRVRPDGEPLTVLSPHGRSYIWTRKTPVELTGAIRLAGVERSVSCRGLLDDSAGYHARRTEWRWCAGVGSTLDGRAVTWNLVAGVHDVEPATERAVWLDGVAVPVGAMTMSGKLDRIGTADGADLRFTAESVRRRDDRVLGGLIRSEYVQPFGTFTGTLPGGLELAEGFGVLERHRARW
ncbi:MAG TPA: DUF2804 family protein [Pseudonocardia sp.]